MDPQTELCKLAMTFPGCDRCPHSGGHSYTPYYSKLFKGMNPRRILEIGIDTGRGLRMWKQYFPEAEIVGLDSNPALLFREDRIKTYHCELSSVASIMAARDMMGPERFDIIFDDGSHIPQHQIDAARIFIPRLHAGGFYIIEDVWDPVTVELGIPYPCDVVEFRVRNNNLSLDDDRLVVFHASGLL